MPLQREQHGESGTRCQRLCAECACASMVVMSRRDVTHSLKHTLIFIMASGHHTVYHLPEPGPTSCREDVSVGSQAKRRSTSGRTARPSPSPTGSRPIRHVQRHFGLVSRNSNSVKCFEI